MSGCVGRTKGTRQEARGERVNRYFKVEYMRIKYYPDADALVRGAFDGEEAKEKGFYYKNHKIIEEEKNESH